MKKFLFCFLLCAMVVLVGICPAFLEWQKVETNVEVSVDTDEDLDDEEEDGDETGEEIDSSATTVTSDAGFTYTLSTSAQTATLSGYSGTTSEITIATNILVAEDGTVTEDPEDSSSGTTYAVTAIGVNAFSGNKTITAVTGGVSLY